MKHHSPPIRPLILVVLLAVLIGTSSFTLGETRMVRLQGKCDLTKRDSREKGLVLEAKANANYEFSVYIDPNGDPFHLVGDAETRIRIAPSADNPTGKRLFYVFFMAFFDDRDKLIACGRCSELGAIEPRQQPDLTGFIKHVLVPSRLISKIARYQFVLYDSDQMIGIETVSGDKVKDPPGDYGLCPAVFKPVKPKVSTIEGETEYYFNLPLTFEEYGDSERKRKLERLRPETLGNLDSLTFQGFRCENHVTTNGIPGPTVWTTQVIIDFDEPRKPDRTIGYRAFVAFLDSKGLLLGCYATSWGNGASGYFDVPHDMLLAIDRAQVVIYQGPFQKKKKGR